MSPNLATVPWISPQYFQARFPDHMARRTRCSTSGACWSREPERAGPWAVLVLEEAVRRVTEAGGVAIFDCCAHNVDRKLPELIARVARRICVLETAELEPQRYFAYTTHGFK